MQDGVCDQAKYPKKDYTAGAVIISAKSHKTGLQSGYYKRHLQRYYLCIELAAADNFSGHAQAIHSCSALTPASPYLLLPAVVLTRSR